MSETPARAIALIGLMGAGKTAVATALGERMGGSVADLDAMIEAAEGCSIADLFTRAGESAFREREREVLREALAANIQVFACGGGVVLDAQCREMLRGRCRVIWLEVSPEVAAQRIGRDGSAAARPLLQGGEPVQRLRDLLSVRSPLYAEVAQTRVSTDGRTPAEIAEEILQFTAGRA